MSDPNRTISPKTTQGENFRTLLQAATGKDYSDIKESDVEKWASAQGWRNKDVNRIVKGFTKFSKKDKAFNLTDEGEFRIEGGSGSGRRMGNRKGFDLGDLVGLGRDVSLLGGALETVKLPPPEDVVLETSEDAVLGTPEETIESPIEGAGEGELQTYVSRAPDAVTPSGQGTTQAAAQELNNVNKNKSPKQKQVPESIPDIAYSPTDVLSSDTKDLELSNPLPRLMLPDDKSYAPIRGDVKPPPKANTVDIYGFQNPVGKDDKGYYEALDTGDKRYIKSDDKRYRNAVRVYNQGGEKDIVSLLGKAAGQMGKIFKAYTRELDKQPGLRTPSEMLSNRRFGGKTKFSR